MYVAPNRRDSRPVLEGAVASGASAVVLTVDTPVLGTHYPLAEGSRVWEWAEEGWLGVNAAVPIGLGPGDRDKAMDLGPEDLAWLATTTGLPVVVKGVLRADDARQCVAARASAVCRSRRKVWALSVSW